MNLFLYVLLIFFYFVSKIIGLRLSSILGGIIVYCYGIFSQKNSIGIKNLTIVFPEKTLREKKAILGKMWFHFGRVIGEYAHLDKIDFNDESVIKIEKIENLLNPIKNGNCIFSQLILVIGSCPHILWFKMDSISILYIDLQIIIM